MPARGLLSSVVLFGVLVGSPELSFGDGFDDGLLLVASSRTDEVRIYDAETLQFLSAFTHPEFSEVQSDLFTFGPNGMAFNEHGHLVVAAYDSFVEFCAPGVAVATYPKFAAEATENVIFDLRGNLYTTTATGGSGLLLQYSGTGYVYQQTIALPPGSGSLTGITFDAAGRLFVASQDDAMIHVLEPDDPSFGSFSLSHSIPSANPSALEGLQINQNGELLAAGGDITRYDPDTGAVLGVFDCPGDQFPVPVTVDDLGRIYVSDYEDGFGAVGADVFRFSPDGSECVGSNDPGLLGPFGNVISGATLPGDPVGFARADCNASGVVDIADPVFLLSWLFSSGPDPDCNDACDSNDDGALDIADPIYTLAYLFQMSTPPPAPFAACALDPTPDDLGCGSFGACP